MRHKRDELLPPTIILKIKLTFKKQCLILFAQFLFLLLLLWLLAFLLAKPALAMSHKKCYTKPIIYTQYDQTY